MELSNIINKSIEIANKNKYLVRFWNSDLTSNTEKEMTYMELGTFLIAQKEKIEIIHIYAKRE